MSVNPEPDTKDWTWVLDRACPECGFDAAAVDVADVGPALRSNAEAWATVLTGPHATRRPQPGVWSPGEYGAHVRDVHRIFGERVRLMLDVDEPTFANWDQDAAAIADRYDLQDPAEVAPDLRSAAHAVAARYDDVTPEQLPRRGLRSNGSEFTVDTIAHYHLHDVVHHLWDVRAAATVAAYDAAARDYRDAAPGLTGAASAALDAFASRLRPGARVLEVGSGGGRDAAALEERGLSVRRTDVTPAFVGLLREQGHTADVLDPLTDDLDDPRRPGVPYDAVWANASLLHVARPDLPAVLERLAAATRPDGVLRLSVKEGDGEGWSVHGAVSSPRSFVYWRRADLCAVPELAGWNVDAVQENEGHRGERWLAVTAYRRP